MAKPYLNLTAEFFDRATARLIRAELAQGMRSGWPGR